MKVSAKFAHLHGPLFFAGKNWGEKLDIKNTAKGKIKLTYDRAEKELIVEHGTEVTFIPSSNVVSWQPIPDSLKGQVALDMAPSISPHIPVNKGRVKAQASSPMDHVHQGFGAGKTND